MSATTTELLSSGEFCKLRYETIPVKSASATFLSIPITQKCQILSCDTLVANERNVFNCFRRFRKSGKSDYWLRHVCLSVSPSTRLGKLGYH